MPGHVRRVRSRHARLAALAVAALITFVSMESRAEQFVLFDATFTYTWDDAINAKPSKSHYYVNEGNWLNKQRPANWMTPVNYRDGKVHIHLEVLEKPPGTQQAGWALCYVANAGSYGCPYTDYYKGVGAYEKDVDMHTFYNNTTIQWDKGVKQVDLVYTINGSGSGHITNFPELKDLVTPTKVRITMVQVSMGATYDPSILGASTPAEPPRDGGSVPPRDGGAAETASDAGGATADASAPPDLGTPPATGAAGAAGAGAAGMGAAGAGGTGAGGVAGSGAAGATPAPPATGSADSNGSTGGTGVSPGGHVASGGCRVVGNDGDAGPPLAAGAMALVVVVVRRRRRAG